jgi:hypothetical protein
MRNFAKSKGNKKEIYLPKLSNAVVQLKGKM